MFTTKINIDNANEKLDYETRFFTLGSCFSDNIGNKLKKAFFDVEINPFGVLFNPISILKSIEILLEKKLFVEQDLFFHASLWGSLSHSMLFSASTKEKTLSNINQRIEHAIERLKYCDVLLITFGTAWVYESNKTGEVVTNCHKLPSSLFSRRRLTIFEIVESYTSLIQSLDTLYPNKRIIFTVSPIRHWKDGAHENNLSKSILHLAIEELQKRFENVSYYPAYEIQMDELRDYRYYATDMFHPSDVAIDYIWMRFYETYFSTQSVQLIKKLENFASQLAHRPLHADTKEYADFLESVKKQRVKLTLEYPFLANRI